MVTALAESFFSRFKAELVEGGLFESVAHIEWLLQSNPAAFIFGLSQSAGA
jgi:hypothetical protein